MKTLDLIKKYRHIFRTDYTQDAACIMALLMDIDEDPLTDSSGSGNTGTLKAAGEPNFATASPPPGGFSTGYYNWNGDDYVSTTTLGNFGTNILTDPSSVVSWAKSSDTTSRLCVMGTVNDGTAIVYQIFLNTDSLEAVSAGRIHVQIRDSNAHRLRGGIDSDTGITDGDWHHLGVVVNCANLILKVYVDGVLQSFIYDVQEPFNADDNFQYPMYVGARNLRSVADRFFTDSLDEFGMFENKELDSTEFNDIMDNGLLGVVANPYPVNRLRKDVISGYHCFMGGYIDAKRKGYDPLKLPDGTVF